MPTGRQAMKMPDEMIGTLCQGDSSALSYLFFGWKAFGMTDFWDLISGKFISYAADAMKVLRIAGIFLKVFAEGEYEVVDSAGGRIYIITPYIL